MQTLSDLVFHLRDQWTGRKELLTIRRKRRTESLSGGELVAGIHALALSLEGRGVKQGDRIALLSENCPEWHMIDFACHLLGAVSVPIYPNLPADQVAFIVKNSGSQWLFYRSEEQRPIVESVARGLASELQFVAIEDEGVENTQTPTLTWLLGEGAAMRSSHSLERFRDRSKATDLASLVYTSGTTGEPKGVALTHGNLVSNLLGCAQRFELGPEDRALSFLPLSHAFERTVCHLLLYSGAAITYAPKVEQVSRLLPQVRPTILSSVPRLYERIYRTAIQSTVGLSPRKKRSFERALNVGREYLAAKDRGLVNPLLALRRRIADRFVFRHVRQRLGGQLRLAICGGAALAPPVEEFFDIIGLPIHSGYGLTEASPVLSANGPRSRKRGSVGRPLGDVELKLAGDKEILVRGAGIMHGYWENDDATAKVLDAHGWLYTGDLGRLDAEGYLFITDRKKDLIATSNGKNIAPQPIELALSDGELISQAIVVGEGYPYVTALLVPRFEVFEETFGEHRSAELMKMASATGPIDREVEAVNQQLAPHEQVRAWTLLPENLTVASGDLTPLLNVRRRRVMRKFDALIRGLYPTEHSLPSEANAATEAQRSEEGDAPQESSEEPMTDEGANSADAGKKTDSAKTMAKTARQPAPSTDSDHESDTESPELDSASEPNAKD